MSDVYIDDSATGLNDGTSWTDAYSGSTQAVLTSAMTDASAANDIIYMADTSQILMTASVSLTVNANHTPQNPLEFIVGTPNGALGITAISGYGTTGNGEISGAATSLYDIQWNGGSVNFWALRYVHMDGQNIGTSDYISFENSLWLVDKTSSPESFLFSSGQVYEWINSRVEITGNNHFLDISNDSTQLLMRGGTLITDVSVTRLIDIASIKSAYVSITGCDYSGMNSSTDFVDLSGVVEGCIVEILGGKPPATVPNLFSGARTNLTKGSRLLLVADEPHIHREEKLFGGRLEEEVIYRSGGSSANSTPYSVKIESTSDSSRKAPYRLLLGRRNFGDLDTTTLKVHFAQNSGSALTNDEIWIEVQAATSTGVYQDSDKTNRGATGSAHTDESGSEDWRNGAGALSGYNEQSCSVSPAETTSGVVDIWLCIASTFTTNNLFICGKMDIA